ncbi:MAG: sphingosine kinase, partial [Acidimicrobiaceae bacterium]|nr:sphingosine kinase [Acidimicrobiaceae bacterium]
MMKVSLLVNPLAGKGKAISIAEELKGLLNELGAEVSLLIPESRSKVVEIATDSVNSGIDRLVTVGGDGLINQAVNVLAGTGTTLGVIPVGTGND